MSTGAAARERGSGRPAVSCRYRRGGGRRSPAADRGVAAARAGAGRRLVTGRAARDGAGPWRTTELPNTTGAEGEAKLNALPHFMDRDRCAGRPFHPRLKSQHQDALPLIVSHGWPGSIIEQLKIIEPLTNPTEEGGSASDVFDVVIPSLPGYGFSGKPDVTGWDPGPHRHARGRC